MSGKSEDIDWNFQINWNLVVEPHFLKHVFLKSTFLMEISFL